MLFSYFLIFILKRQKSTQKEISFSVKLNEKRTQYTFVIINESINFFDEINS